MNYYEQHIGDYDKATAHLTACEDGIYGRLMRRYYDTEEPLTADVKELQRLVRARTKEERAAVVSILKEFFQLLPDGFHQRRCDNEITKFQDKRAKAKRSANVRWKNAQDIPSVPDANAPANAMRTHSVGNALQTPVKSIEQKHSLRSQRAREADEPNPQPSLNPESWRLFREHHAELGKWSGARESLAAGQCRAMIAQGIDPNPVLEWATARSLADLTDAHRRMTSDRHASNGNGHAAPTASPPRKPGIDRGADETPLERQLAWLRHQAQLGAITPEQHVEQARSARERLSVTP